MSLASPLVTRRNGKTQACEPCRRRKVACDHGYPVCRRCRRRPNGESACYYASPNQGVQSDEPTIHHQPAHQRSGTDSGGVEGSFQSNRHLGPEDGIWSSPAARAPLGFFGPTSFAAAYLETETSLAAHASATTAEALPSPLTTSTTPTPADIRNMVNLDQPANYLAIRILKAIPEKPAITSFRFYTDPNDGWMQKIGERLVVSAWETFGPYLRDRGNTNKLRELGSMICINTRRKLEEDQEDPLAWIESFSGPNLRWEAIGIMFLYKALGEFSASTSAESQRLARHYTDYCASCITLANMGGSSGPLMLFLLYKRSVLHSCMHGETSLPYWKFHAETVAMLTFSGFHDNRSGNLSMPSSGSTAAIEARRRIGCQIFVVDKFLATFFGRPPLLTRRFCSIQLPLDLDDATLLSDGETFQRHIQRLETNGWNVDGQVRSSSLLRVRMMMALVRDEILEVVLDQNGEHVIDDIMKLKDRELELYNKLPTHVICSPAREDIREIDPGLVYAKLLIRLDHLLNVFLVERLLVKHGSLRHDLLRTSFEMIVLTLHCWTQRHTGVQIQEEHQWVMGGYASLAGAVLCKELMHSDPVSMATDEIIILGEDYSRSSIIQQLSLLVGYLSSSVAASSRGSVAPNIRGIIKKVLDHILNARGSQTPTGLGNFDFETDWDMFVEYNPIDDVNWLAGDLDTNTISGI